MDFGTGEGFTSASSIRYIKCALAEQTARFEALASDIAKFEPKSFDEMLKRTKKDFAAAKELNSPENWEEMVRQQAEGRAKPHVQFFFAFHDRHYASCITNVVLSAATCEAAANTVCAIHSVVTKNTDVFDKFERYDLKKKWVSGLRLIQPNYQFDKSTALYEALDRMVTLRNSYLHHKIGIWSSDEKTTLAGSKTPNIGMDSAGIDMMRRILGLPTDLINHLLDQTSDAGQKFQFSAALM